MTKLGWPVALPRLSSRPSDSTITAWPSGKTHLSTWGLMLTRWMPGNLARPAMSISLSKWPMLPTMAWCFISAMWLGRDDVAVPGGRHEDVGSRDDVLDHRDLIALHRGLQRADRVDLGHHHPGALAGE